MKLLSLCVLLAVCSVSFALEWSRLNAHVVENGSHIEKNSTHYSISMPSGDQEHYRLSEFTCATCGHKTHSPQPAASGNGKRDSSATGWVSSFWSWGNNYTYMSSQWTVPTAPSSNGGNIIFFFNSLEGLTSGGGSGADILQPVLQFNNIIGGWSLASWYGDSNGYVHSTPITVNVGDLITGVMTLSGGVWYVYGYVNGVLTTTLTVAQASFAGGVRQNTAQWVLEVYSMPDCTYYPPENFLTVSDIVLKDGGVVVASPTWSVPSTYAQACNAAGYSATSTATSPTSTSSNALTITWQSGNAKIGTARALATVGVDITDKTTSTTCVGPISEGATATLTCPSGQVISSVSFASYGTASGSCGSFAKGSCDSATSLSVVQTQCLHKNTCSFTSSNTVFGDPCVGTAKHLDAQVICSTDLGSQTATSALACASACDNTTLCAGWVWDTKSTCYLKSSVGARTANSSVVSSVKQGEVGYDRPGTNLPGYPITLPSGSTASTCAAYCNGNAACQAWSFDTCGTSCWLKSSTGTRTSASCRISGVKGVMYSDHSGSDLSSSVLANSADATQCANLCASTTSCTNWAFVLPSAGCETTNNCWLKNGAGVPTESISKCRISGVVH